MGNVTTSYAFFHAQAMALRCSLDHKSKSCEPAIACARHLNVFGAQAFVILHEPEVPTSRIDTARKAQAGSAREFPVKLVRGPAIQTLCAATDVGTLLQFTTSEVEASLSILSTVKCCASYVFTLLRDPFRRWRCAVRLQGIFQSQESDVPRVLGASDLDRRAYVCMGLGPCAGA